MEIDVHKQTFATSGMLSGGAVAEMP